jgi:hypothetical protein
VDQHVISAWLLRAFARGSPELAQYDKSTDSFSTVSPEEFLVESDGHSAGIERGIERIETPASRAAMRRPFWDHLAAPFRLSRRELEDRGWVYDDG